MVLTKAGKVLVVSQGGTSWSLPKGHIEDGEDAIDAAKREIYEEAGIKDLQLIKDLVSYKRHKIALSSGEESLSSKQFNYFYSEPMKKFWNQLIRAFKGKVSSPLKVELRSTL